MPWFFDEIANLWITAAPLSDFGHAIGVSFEANLAYSALVEYGDFQWSPVSKSVAQKRSAVVVSLSETAEFNYPEQIGKLGTAYSNYINRINKIASGWAILAAIADALILTLMPFYSDQLITGRCVAECAVVLFFAVPFGALGIFAVHIVAWMHLERLARRFKDVIHFAQTVVSKKIDATRAFLREAEKDKQDIEDMESAAKSEPPTPPEEPGQPPSSAEPQASP